MTISKKCTNALQASVMAGMLLSCLSQALGQVTLQKVGNPSWKPVDFHVFSARIGKAPNFEDFGINMQALLPPPQHVCCIDPGTPHPPPYDLEFDEGVQNNCFKDQTTFSVQEFNLPRGVWAVFMIVPDAGSPTGSSPDFRRGPIIPNHLFPIQIKGFDFRNGEPFSPFNEFGVAPIGGLDGHSHFPLFFVDARFFGPKGTNPVGRYEYRLETRDTEGSGWNILVQFRVTNKKPQCH